MKTILRCLLSLAAALPAAADDFGLPAERPDIRVPEVSAGVPAVSLADYASYYSALEFYSARAFSADRDSAVFFDARSRGMYLRERVQELGARILAGAAADPCGTRLAMRQLGEEKFRELLPRLPAAACPGAAKSAAPPAAPPSVARPVAAELDALFSGAGARKEEDDGVIKPGYCHIKYVKNGVPYLVQSDSFLKRGEVIVTFDDGPGDLTHEVSAAMKEGAAPSIFFVLGRNIAGTAGKGPIRTQAADGHSVAVHGLNHATERDKPFTFYDTPTILSQLRGVAASIKTVTGAEPKYFRPPYGIIQPDALRSIASDLDLVPVGWTIDTLDWSTKDPEALFASVTAMVQKRGKGIVLMHDIHPQSRAAAARLAGWLKDNGYTVVSPDRLVKAFKGR